MKMIRNIAYKVLRIHWKITKPVTAGVRALLINNNEILLVKHTYQENWYLPGGGLKKGESYEEAIRREIKEEINGIINDLELFGVYNNFYESKNDTVVIFYSSNFVFDESNSSEIESVKMFHIDSLPANISPGSKRRIEEYLKKSKVNYGIW